MKKGYQQTQPHSKWYKGGTAKTPGGASMTAFKPAANNPKGHKKK